MKLPASLRLLALLVGAAPAWALPSKGIVSLNTDAHGAYFVLPREEGQDLKDAYTDAAVASTLLQRDSHMGFSNGSLANAWAEAGLGRLHVRADAAFPAQYGLGYITGHARASFTDYVPVGPAGSTYHYKASYTVSGTHSIPGFEVGGGFQADAVAGLTVYDWLGQAVSINRSWSSTDTSSSWTLVIDFNYTPQHADAYLVVGGFLEVNAYVSGSSAFRVAESDYSRSAHFHLSSSNGGGTLGVSGVDYAVGAVPEPGTLALWLGGLALGWRVRRSFVPAEAP